MNSAHLNEHDANQGAQSSGEFLGMTGNSGWWLLGSGGATIMMVVFLWGILGMSLLLCLLIGAALCALSLAYVFALKNNKPAHYDLDFFESVLSEAGLWEFRFTPPRRFPRNPFADDNTDAVASGESEVANKEKPPREMKRNRTHTGAMRNSPKAKSATTQEESAATKKKVPVKAATDTMTTDVAVEALHEELEQTREMLDEALFERGGD